MPRQNALLQALNRGLVSADALGRIDVEELRLAAEEMDNWLPMRLGPMRLRPGLGYLGATRNNDPATVIPFIAGTLETALLELTTGCLRVWVDDALLTRPSVSTSVAVLTSSSGWTDASTNGASLTFDANGLTLNPTNAGGIAKCTRQITVAGGDQNKEHGLTVVVPTGYDPVYFRVGSTAGAENYIAETRLLAGEHHLAFTPTGDFHLTIWATDRYAVTKRVTSIVVDAAGVVTIATPWTTNDLDLISFEQSADVIFIACKGQKQKRIERRSDRSWSVVDYRAFDGPFVGQTSTAKLKPALYFSRTTLTADRPFFKADHVGGLFRLFHNGQVFRMDVGGEAVYTDPIRVNGVQGTNYNERAFGITTAGTWSGTLNVERSLIGDDVGFGEYPRDASAATTADITTNTTYSNEDEDDNLVAWYRVGFQPGNYVSGTAQVTFAYAFGGDYGLARVTAYNSSTSVDIEVLRIFRGIGYTDNWSEGAWTASQGFPTCVRIHEGRLWWFAGSQIWGSVSDAFESYDQENTNDDGPIVRTIGAGPVDNVNFALALGRLVIGTDGAELVLRSSSVDEPITPTSFSIKPISTFGSKANFPAIQIDETGLFVHRSGKHLLEIAPGQSQSGYVTTDLTLAVPDLLEAGVVSIAVQRFPETRVHCVLDDGTVAVLTYDQAENLRSWVKLSVGWGEIERVAVLPRVDEDAVYYVVKRTIGGSTKRYLEKFALLSECRGGTLNKQLDSFVVVTNSPASTTVSGLSHLEGAVVKVWADGNVVEEADETGGYRAKSFVVASGAITLPAAASNIVVGLGYQARFKSAKLAYAAAGGTALNQRKVVPQLGLLLGTTHHRGLRHGRAFGALEEPLLLLHFDGVDGATLATDSSTYDRPVMFAGNAQLDTAKAKFGSSSLLLDGTGDWLTVPDSTDWTFAGDFTVDAWAWANSLAAQITLFGHATDTQNYYRLAVATDGAVSFILAVANVQTVVATSSAGAVTTGAWNHFAVVRSGRVWTVYVNGVSVASATDPDVIANFDGTFQIGAVASILPWNGWIDEFRVSNFARWTAAFAVPTSAQTPTTIMNNLPQNVNGADVATGTIHSSFDQPMVPFEGDWDTDSRVCLEGNAPYPVTVKALVVGVHTSG